MLGTVALLLAVFGVAVVWVEVRGGAAHGDAGGGGAGRGVHEPHTASIDFCEPNYAHSPYVVELQNSASSVGIMALACWGYEQVQTHALAFFLLYVTGLGSVFFHGTMQRAYQAMDEVGMMGVIICMLVYQHDKSHPTLARPAGVAFFVLSCLAYLVSTNPALFQSMFILCVVALVVRTVGLTRSSLHPEARRLLLTAFVVFSSSATLWLAEPFLCHWRLPIQFHSVWHIGSAFGCVLWLKLATIVY